MGQEEKRRHKRIAVDIPAIIYAQEMEQQVGGRVKDISLGGAYIECEHSFSLGTKILVEIRYEGIGVLQAKVNISKELLDQVPPKEAEASIIRWKRTVGEKGFGIQFVNLNDINREFLEKLVDHIENKSSE